MKTTKTIVLALFSLLFTSCSLFKEEVEIVTGKSPGAEIISAAHLLEEYLNSMYVL